MKLIVEKKRDLTLITKLVEIWQRSVKVTHSFLSTSEIAEIRKFVPQALNDVPVLVVAFDKSEPVGFMGIAGNKLEMLFLDPTVRRQGLGRQLVTYGFDHYAIDQVVVNEQNSAAVGFYQHLGFEIVARSPIDEQGQPYPILMMYHA